MIRNGENVCALCFSPTKFVDVKTHEWTIYGLKSKKKRVQLSCPCR